MEDKKKGSAWPWLIAASAAAGIFFWAKKSSAAPAPAAGGSTAAAATTPSMADIAASQSSLLHGLLTQKGFGTIPSYETATAATEEIVDVTPGRNRVLSSENQGQTDNFHAFMWDTNAILKFKNFDPSNWTKYLSEFEKAKAYFQTL